SQVRKTIGSPPLAIPRSATTLAACRYSSLGTLNLAVVPR
ncbi:hypothetical protein A2U01_0049383, partial [Trifolium medium]|nr:hypothetical protein [Trifolium medium]